MEAFIDFCKQMLALGIYNINQIAEFVSWGSITADDYKAITGNDYSETSTVEK
ncbi:XkdX family protein [Lactobacillus sp. ESL0677]|uniref:XkdX family protein n=1 Tax=Lactobacillus sp. ESL0677 TaxID=2983208 RepID=UPI0023F7D7CA|nr:XkdX family protein [Lactobacillus sp. ESL0677]WEV36204.1 XkdX family protein [Lactobacillus sp. ESL0677]